VGRGFHASFKQLEGRVRVGRGVFSRLFLTPDVSNALAQPAPPAPLWQGYMVGPPLGGILFDLGGFSTPFLVLGLALLPAAALIYYRLPPDDRRRSNDENKGDVSMKARSEPTPFPLFLLPPGAALPIYLVQHTYRPCLYEGALAFRHSPPPPRPPAPAGATHLLFELQSRPASML
jgi:hypothetical protein